MSLHALIIGAGSTGAALAHDLALRGYRVTVVDRGEIAGETTGSNHGLFHSGARYALTDQEAARECAEDNAILRRLMPGILELNDGLFVALNEEDLSQKEKFLEGCAQAGIPAQDLGVKEALRLEPNLNQKILAAVRVPDGVFDPVHFTLAFLATAKQNGTVVHHYTEVIDLLWSGKNVAGVRVRERCSKKEREIGADLVVNAAGPWCGRIGAMAGLDLRMAPTAGVMVSAGRRWTQMVINRLHKPGDGDILVPQRRAAVIGTTSWLIEDPDFIPIPDEHVKEMLARAEEMIPGYTTANSRGAWSSARPLMAEGGSMATQGRALTRGVYTFNHAEDGVPGIFTLTGGKTTTSRLMAEGMADLIGKATGVTEPCRTHDVPLISYHAFFAS